MIHSSFDARCARHVQIHARDAVYFAWNKQFCVSLRAINNDVVGWEPSRILNCGFSLHTERSCASKERYSGFVSFINIDNCANEDAFLRFSFNINLHDFSALKIEVSLLFRYKWQWQKPIMMLTAISTPQGNQHWVGKMRLGKWKWYVLMPLQHQ